MSCLPICSDLEIQGTRFDLNEKLKKYWNKCPHFSNTFLIENPYEKLAGSDLSWREWKVLNRFCSGHGCCGEQYYIDGNFVTLQIVAAVQMPIKWLSVAETYRWHLRFNWSELWRDWLALPLRHSCVMIVNSIVNFRRHLCWCYETCNCHTINSKNIVLSFSLKLSDTQSKPFFHPQFIDCILI